MVSFINDKVLYLASIAYKGSFRYKEFIKYLHLFTAYLFKENVP